MPQRQFDYGYMGGRRPSADCVFSLSEADTSSETIHATMVPRSKKMDMPYHVAATAKGVRDLMYDRYLHRDKGDLQLLLDRSGKIM